MTLIERINIKYDQAVAELMRIKTAPPVTPQQRYDRKKALAQGRTPFKSVRKIDALINELNHEREYILRGIREACQELVDYDVTINDAIKEVISGHSEDT